MCAHVVLVRKIRGEIKSIIVSNYEKMKVLSVSKMVLKSVLAQGLKGVKIRHVDEISL